MSQKKIIDPYKINYSMMPMIVFVDNANNFISWAIKWKTKGIYNHVMNMMDPFAFLSQDPTGLHITPLDRYLKRENKLKFYTTKFPKAINDRIIQEMIIDSKKPWWKTMYDFLGILGQAIGEKRLNNPFKMFCQERNRSYMLFGDPDFPKHLSPEEADQYMRSKPNLYELYGYWFMD